MTTLVHGHESFFLHPSTPRPPALLPPKGWHPALYESVSVLLVNAVCSLDSTYKWNHMVFVFLWHISLITMFSRSNHAVSNGKFSYFLWPSSIPLCKCPIVVLSTYLLMDMGCFPILAIVNDAAMNIGVPTFFWISVLESLGYIPRNGITGSKGRSIFNFLRGSILLSTVAAWICIPTNSAKEPPFLHILTSTFLFLIYRW